jgi:hypothetical protein
MNREAQVKVCYLRLVFSALVSSTRSSEAQQQLAFALGNRTARGKAETKSAQRMAKTREKTIKS